MSYLRLTPNRWAPTAIDIVQQDRGGALRVCPVFAADSPADTARQFNLEFRVSDGAASPYLALGAVIFAGADGLRRKLGLPPSADRAEITHGMGPREPKGRAGVWTEEPVFGDEGRQRVKAPGRERTIERRDRSQGAPHQGRSALG